MKKAFICILLLAIAIMGCTTKEETSKIGADISVSIEDEESSIVYEEEVRFTAEGFETGEVNVKNGESLTILIVDDDLQGHYLAITSDRVAKKELIDSSKVNLPFNKEGTYLILDETSGHALTVNVK